MYDLQLTNWSLTYIKTSEKQNYKLFMKKNMFRYITNAANIKTSEKQNYKLFMKKNMFRYITNAANIKRIFPRNM